MSRVVTSSKFIGQKFGNLWSYQVRHSDIRRGGHPSSCNLLSCLHFILSQCSYQVGTQRAEHQSKVQFAYIFIVLSSLSLRDCWRLLRQQHWSCNTNKSHWFWIGLGFTPNKCTAAPLNED